MAQARRKTEESHEPRRVCSVHISCSAFPFSSDVCASRSRPISPARVAGRKAEKLRENRKFAKKDRNSLASFSRWVHIARPNGGAPRDAPTRISRLRSEPALSTLVGDTNAKGRTNQDLPGTSRQSATTKARARSALYKITPDWPSEGLVLSLAGVPLPRSQERARWRPSQGSARSASCRNKTKVPVDTNVGGDYQHRPRSGGPLPSVLEN